MTTPLIRTGGLLLLSALLCVSTACNKNQGDGSPGSGNRGGPGGPPSPMREAMTRIGKGPQSLHESLKGELNADPVPWDSVRPQAKEYARLAASLAQYEPPRGGKESWAKLTASFTESATALERAAEAGDKKAALEAHGTLSRECMACHREHRMKGPGGPPPGAPKP